MRFSFVLLSFVSFLIVISLVASYSTFVVGEVFSGKNMVVFNESFYVKDFIKFNPEVEAVTYYDEGVSVGFVNVFIGVGENFFIIPNKTYEVFSSKNLTLIMPK